MAPEFGKPIHHLPLIPANVLEKHHVNEPLDTRFRSAADLSGRWISSCGVISHAATNTGVHTGREARFFTICSSYAPILNQRREISR